MMAMSDFASDVDSEPGGPSLPSGVHLVMPDLADSDSVLQVSDYVNFGVPRSGATSPRVRECDGDVRFRR